MDIEHWADIGLSERLHEYRRAGEGQSIEFKREMPPQARDLAKEIAAFATSNDGLILLGIADDAELVGIPDAHDPKVRDELGRRILGVCASIKPSVRPALYWAMENGVGVLCVRVTKGREPIYYVHHQPYIRHSSVSRPAEPNEVVDLIRAFLEREAGKTETAAPSAFFSALARRLAVVLRWGDSDPSVRDLKPWVDRWQFDARTVATGLRDLAAEGNAVQHKLVERLQHLASRLDRVAGFVHTLGGGSDFDAATLDARNEAWKIMVEVVHPIPIHPSVEDDVRQSIAKSARKLADSWARAIADPFSGAIEAAQGDSASVSRELMEFSYYLLPLLSGTRAKDLRQIGAQLLGLEAQRLYMDGGESQRRVANLGLEVSAALTTFVAA